MAATAVKQKTVTIRTQPRPHLLVELACLVVISTITSWVLFTGLGSVPLFNPDEAFYAEPAREMLDTHNFLTTTLNYKVRYTKPPLSMWATALSYQAFGQNEFAARFFSACAAMVLAAATFCFLARFVTLRAGVLAAMVLVTSPLYVGMGRLAVADMPLALFVATSLFAFFRAYQEKQSSYNWLAYSLIALAVLTKGPVGVVLPVLALFAFHFLRGDLIAALKFYRPDIGALIVAVIALPWFAVETLVTRGEYFNCFIMMENFHRFTRVVSGHAGPWSYHLIAIALGFLPWSLFLPQSLFGVAVDMVGRVKSATLRIVRREERIDSTPSKDLEMFAACSALAIVLFFSLCSSKLLSYTLPSFPFIAALIACHLDRALTAGNRRALLVPMVILATVYGIGFLVIPSVLAHIHRAPNFLAAILTPYAGIQFVSTILAIGLVMAKRPVIAQAVFALSCLITFSIFGAQAVTAISQEWEQPAPDFARFAALSGEPLFIYKVRLPSVPFYTHQATMFSPALESPMPGTDRYTGVAGEAEPPTLSKDGKPGKSPPSIYTQIENAIANSDRAYVIAKSAEKNYFTSHQGFKILNEKGRFILVHWLKPPASTSQSSVMMHQNHDHSRS